MDMKKQLFSLAGMLVLSLLTSVTFAGKEDPATKYLPSDPGGITPRSGVIKFLRDCPVGTDALFKNVSPFISGGPGGTPGETYWSGTFPVDGSEVTLDVYWRDDNSYRFEASGGVVWAVGPEVDADKLIYEYGSPVFADGGHNVLDAGGDSAAVNHLDLCLSLADTTKPVIVFDPPLNGETVSGDVTVTVKVTDESGLFSVLLSVNDGQTTDVPMECLPVAGSQDQFACSADWLASEFPGGVYTITVVATDNAVPDKNTQTASVTVTLAKSFVDCFGTLGDEDFSGDPEPGTAYTGCEPTPFANVQVPPDTTVCNPALATGPIPAFCYISGVQLLPDSRLNSGDATELGNFIAELTSLYGGCDACVPDYCGDSGLPDPRMECTRDSSGDCTDEWKPRQLTPLTIADVAEGDPAGVLGEYVYGYKGCFAAAQHFKGNELYLLYDAWPEQGLVFIKRHDPAALIAPGQVAACNVGMPHASQAGYLPIGKSQSVDTTSTGIAAITLAATQECQNPPRTLTRDNGVDVSNIIETDGSDDPLAFKYQMAQTQFDALYNAVDCAEPDFTRGKIKFSDVTSPINQAQAQFSNGSIAALQRAREDLQAAACAIRSAKWEVTAENCPGDALARAENLAWRMTDLLAAQGVPFDPLDPATGSNCTSN
jgi:hypothetical protein